MVRISFSPAEELVVHEVVEMGKEVLLLERITPAGNMPLYWCGGIVFSFSSIPMTDEVVKEYLKGRIHWAEVHFARLEKYVPVITFESVQIDDERQGYRHQLLAAAPGVRQLAEGEREEGTC